MWPGSLWRRKALGHDVRLGSGFWGELWTSPRNERTLERGQAHQMREVPDGRNPSFNLVLRIQSCGTFYLGRAVDGAESDPPGTPGLLSPCGCRRISRRRASTSLRSLSSFDSNSRMRCSESPGAV